MTTFTLQDLTINNLPTTPEEDEMFKTMAEMSKVNAFETPVFSITPPQHAPVSQPTLCESTQTPDLSTIINTICTQLQLLATVIKDNPSTTPPEGDQPSLQETIELTLQQAVWFEKMVQEQVEERVESEIEDYFHHRFDPSNYFDFNDAINNEVSDQISDIVRDQLDDVVADKLEEVVAEKLSEASLSISF